MNRKEELLLKEQLIGDIIIAQKCGISIGTNDNGLTIYISDKILEMLNNVGQVGYKDPDTGRIISIRKRDRKFYEHKGREVSKKLYESIKRG